jgi:hypothetical protein
MIAKGDRFSLSEAEKTLTLDPAQGERMELRYAEQATIWGDRLRGDGETGEVTVDRAQVIVVQKGALMLFTGGKRDEPENAASELTKIYINADKMILRKMEDRGVTLVFDGSVRVASRSADAVMEDTMTAGTLAFDVVSARLAGTPQAAAEEEDGTEVAAARAAGGVTMHIAGEELIVDGAGDSFEWDKKSNVGKLLGSPASVWDDQGSSAKADEILWDFNTRMASMVRGRGGNILLVGRKKAEAAAPPAPTGQ